MDWGRFWKAYLMYSANVNLSGWGTSATASACRICSSFSWRSLQECSSGSRVSASLTLPLAPLVLDTVTVEHPGVVAEGVVVTGDWGSSSWHSSSTWLVVAPLQKLWTVRWVTWWGSRNWNLAHIHCWQSVISTAACPLFFLLSFRNWVRMLSKNVVSTFISFSISRARSSYALFFLETNTWSVRLLLSFLSRKRATSPCFFYVSLDKILAFLLFEWDEAASSSSPTTCATDSAATESAAESDACFFWSWFICRLRVCTLWGMHSSP